MERIAVIGGGVAGLSATRRLAMVGCAPLLIAQDADVPARGETLSTAAVRSLAELGWSDLLHGDAVLAGEGRFSVWGDTLLRRAAEQGNGYHLDRTLFETRMDAAVSLDGTERVRLRAEALEHLPRGVRVVLSDGSQIDMAAVIDCTGRGALSCGPTANRRRLDRLTAAFRVLDIPDETEVFAATLVEAVAAGWWYVAPMPGRRIMLGLFTDSDLLPAGMARDGSAWAAQLGETVAVAARLESLGLGAAVAARPPTIAAAASTFATQLVEGRVLRAGDAAAALDPLGANGLATALWSGLRAAEASVALLTGGTAAAEEYEQSFLEGIAQYLSVERSMYASERRFAASPFWIRRRPAA